MLSSGESPPKYTPVVINFSQENLKRGSESWLSTSKKVRQALEEHGIFAAVDDDSRIIPMEISNGAMLRELEMLFGLPKETKKKNTSDIVFFNAYMEPSPLLPLMESLSIEESISPEAVDSFTKLMWPSGNDNFREVVNLYAKTALEVRQNVSKMVFDSYGLNESYYDSCNDHFTHTLRFNKYTTPQSDEYVIGCRAHTDKAWYTILQQVNQVNCMQIRPKDKDYWVTVDVPPRSLLVFSGESLKAWSNGRIHTVMHRVLMHGEEIRYSAVQFAHLNKTVQVPEELVDDEYPLQHKSFNCMEDFLVFSDAKIFKEGSIIEPDHEF